LWRAFLLISLSDGTRKRFYKTIPGREKEEIRHTEVKHFFLTPSRKKGE